MAFIYDFDGTLIEGNMQEYGFIDGVGKTPEEFWQAVKKFASDHHMDDNVLAYMSYMVSEARDNKLKIGRSHFKAMGQRIEFFKGVTSWFDTLQNRWGERFALEHYIISAGTEEMIEGCSIRKHFRAVYASRFTYDDADEQYGRPIWPARAINFTNKTQYLFRINKGTDDAEELNKYKAEAERRIPFRRMLFFGDGATDIPCMRLVKERGGHSFAIYPPTPANHNKADLDEKHRFAQRLVAEGRVQQALAGDYRRPGPIAEMVDKVLALLLAEWELAQHLPRAGF